MRESGTPSPTAATTPAPSLCGMTPPSGSGTPNQPERFFVSCGLTPDAFISTSSSPWPGRGTATSSTRSTSPASPNAV